MTDHLSIPTVRADRIAQLGQLRSRPTPVAGRRRSPAAASKVAVAGASVAGLFGLVAAFGIADRSPVPAVEVRAAVTAPAATVAGVDPTSPPVVVRVDANGLAPVPAATTVDLAVPAPPPVAQAPAAQATSRGS